MNPDAHQLWKGPRWALAVLLAVLGYVAERVAGGGGVRGALRVLLWGSAAQTATALIGWLFGVSAG